MKVHLGIALSLMSLTALLATMPESQAAPTPDMKLLASIPIPGTEGWDYLHVDSTARKLFVSRGTHMVVVDIDKNVVVADINDTNGVHGAATDDRDGRGFTSNGRANTVTIFDLKTFTRIEDVPVGGGPDSILYDPSSNRVFTFNGRDKSSTVLDAKTGKVIGTVPLPGKPEGAVADGKGHVYNCVEDQNEIVEIDAKSLKITATWPVAPLEALGGLAIDAAHHRLFASCDGGKMAVVDAITGKVVATPPIGNGPDATGFDPGSGFAFASNGQDGTISVIHEKTPDIYEPVATIPTKPGARTMAVDDKTGRIYTCTADVAPPSPSDTPPPTGQRRRRAYLQGTFNVLVYGVK